MKGEITINIGGKIRPIKFGTNATAFFCEERRCTIKDFTEMLSPEKLNSLEITGSEIRDLLWAGLKTGALTRGEDASFTSFDVGNWLDDEDFDKNQIVKAIESMADSSPKGSKKKSPKVKAA